MDGILESSALNNALSGTLGASKDGLNAYKTIDVVILVALDSSSKIRVYTRKDDGQFVGFGGCPDGGVDQVVELFGGQILYLLLLEGNLLALKFNGWLS